MDEYLYDCCALESHNYRSEHISVYYVREMAQGFSTKAALFKWQKKVMSKTTVRVVANF